MKKRVISAVVMLIIVFTCVFLSELSRLLFFAVAGIICAYEYSRAVEKKEVYCCAWVMYVYVAAQLVLAFFHADTNAYMACFTVAVFLALFSGILHKKVSGEGALYTLAGIAVAHERHISTVYIGIMAALYAGRGAVIALLFGKESTARSVYFQLAAKQEYRLLAFEPLCRGTLHVGSEHATVKVYIAGGDGIGLIGSSLTIRKHLKV